MKPRFPFSKINIYLLLTLISISGCKKPVDQWNIPDDFQGWSRYREGTYWIYLNETTQKLDCTYVAKFSSGIYPAYEGNIFLNYQQKEESLIKGSFLSGINTESTNKDYASMTIRCKTLNIYFTTQLLSNPQYYKQSYGGTENHGVIAVYPSEMVNENSFANVYHLRMESQTWLGDSIITDGHLVKDVGLISYKKRFNQSDTSWTLVKWHVIQ
jgi:hypothetical protein